MERPARTIERFVNRKACFWRARLIAIICKPMQLILPVGIHSSQTGTMNMARSKNIENMSFAELAAMQTRIERAKIEKQGAERTALREKLTVMVKEAGFDI